MTATLVLGANTLVEQTEIQCAIRLNPLELSGVEVDISAFLLTEKGCVEGDHGIVFYGQPNPIQGAVILEGGIQGETRFALHLDRVPSAIQRIAFTATVHENRCAFSSFSTVHFLVRDAQGAVLIEVPIATQGMQETALILGELYRRQGQWKCRAVGQGFVGGLGALAPYFGVQVEADTSALPVVSPEPSPAQTPTPNPASITNPLAAPQSTQPQLQPKPVPTVSLSKVSLDKQRPSIDLQKRVEGFGEMRINLNWNQRKPSGGVLGWFGGSAGAAVDLDLGCLFELTNGQKGVVQALGNCFGSFEQAPFVQLLGDDRTGEQKDGEWLRVNGQSWAMVRRILIFAFIYRGAPQWSATDAIVTLYVPGEPDIQIALTEGAADRRMCGIVQIQNQDGAIHVSREMRYVGHHAALDQAYGWGLQWKAGTK